MATSYLKWIRSNDEARRVFFAMLFVAGGLCGGAVARLTARQERPPNYPVTRVWIASALIPRWEGQGSLYQVQVVDTAGVCIYVLVGSNDPQITTVPKTALPPGTGCQ